MMDIKEISDIGSNLASILTVSAAAVWFLYTTQFKPRLQFELDCKFISLCQNRDKLIVELLFIFENKGFVEHRLWNLNISVHALKAEQNLTSKASTKEIEFLTSILPILQLVPKHYEYYFVRPGVRQVISHIIEIPSDLSAIRVTSSFDYQKRKDYPHTLRRVFKVPK